MSKDFWDNLKEVPSETFRRIFVENKCSYEQIRKTYNLGREVAVAPTDFSVFNSCLRNKLFLKDIALLYDDVEYIVGEQTGRVIEPLYSFLFDQITMTNEYGKESSETYNNFLQNYCIVMYNAIERSVEHKKTWVGLFEKFNTAS